MYAWEIDSDGTTRSGLFGGFAMWFLKINTFTEQITPNKLRNMRRKQ